MTIESDDVAVLMVGDPVTLANVERMAPVDLKRGESWEVNSVTHTLELISTGSTTFSITLKDTQLETLKNGDLSHYTQIDSPFSITTNAELDLPTDTTIDSETIPISDGFKPLSYPVKSDADGTFEITFTALDSDALDENEALYDAIANATNTETTATATDVRDAALAAYTSNGISGTTAQDEIGNIMEQIRRMASKPKTAQQLLQQSKKLPITASIEVKPQQSWQTSSALETAQTTQSTGHSWKRPATALQCLRELSNTRY